MVVLGVAFNSYFLQIEIWQFMKEFHRSHFENTITFILEIGRSGEIERNILNFINSTFCTWVIKFTE